jgi:pimeloyl-ACP methyl ester carboxylesterase
VKILYIHGANSTSTSFNYIRSQIDKPSILVDYNCDNGFENNYVDLAKNIIGLDRVYIVAHSLGGIYALHLLKQFPEKIAGAITLSTPYGGSEVANFIKFMIPSCRLLRDIGPSSNPITQAASVKITVPWVNVVTTSGQTPWISGKNDGVISVKSMRARNDIEYFNLEANHHEVLQHIKTIELIKDRVKDENI